MSNSRDITFGWSFPLFAVGGIHVRVHWFFVLWILMQVMNANQPWAVELAEMGILFGSVLLHEFGHSFACRSVGGTADRILLWPLGGLAECDPPKNPWASLWTTLCGPAVNLVLMALALVWLHGQGPDENAVQALSIEQGVPAAEVMAYAKDLWHLNPLTVAGVAEHFYGLPGHWLGLVYLYNFVLFAFNMACVCYPMDAGRVFQEGLWLFAGYARSLWAAAHVGLVFALAMTGFGIYLLSSGSTSLLAVMGGFFLLQGWSLRRSLLALRNHYGSWAAIPDPRDTAVVGGPLGRMFGGGAGFVPKGALGRENTLGQTAGKAVAQEEIDRILRKIAEHGMASLSEEELALLKS